MIHDFPDFYYAVLQKRSVCLILSSFTIHSRDCYLSDILQKVFFRICNTACNTACNTELHFIPPPPKKSNTLKKIFGLGCDSVWLTFLAVFSSHENPDSTTFVMLAYKEKWCFISAFLPPGSGYKTLQKKQCFELYNVGSGFVI